MGLPSAGHRAVDANCTGGANGATSSPPRRYQVRHIRSGDGLVSRCGILLRPHGELVGPKDNVDQGRKRRWGVCRSAGRYFYGDILWKLVGGAARQEYASFDRLLLFTVTKREGMEHIVPFFFAWLTNPDMQVCTSVASYRNET